MKNTWAWIAMLAVGASALVGCVVEEDENVKNTDGGVAGTGAVGGTGGTAGSAGAAGGGTGGTGATAGSGATGGVGATGGSGATAGVGATGGTGGTGGTPACYGDTTSETVACSALPYFSARCDENGTEYPPLGVEACEYTATYGRLGVHEANYDCLASITGDPCSASHDAAVQACLDTVFPRACDTTDTQPEGGKCADFAASCAAITEEACAASYNALTTAAQGLVAQCYNEGEGDCAEDFYACILTPE
ncbi:MAG: hypothetical protein KIT72_17385 [Polyangiaceae bacterium]|nr:hypothetical protein [Polyangiaceae bacterium]MCW5792188.1 hypothetical protein [Polyangiaceae bacterium]